MKYAIYRNNQLLAEVAPQGEVTEKLFGEETVTMSFTLGNYVKFQIGDSVSVYGKSYYISTEPTIEKVSTKEYRYELLFNSIKYRLAEVQYFFYDEQNLLTMPEFSIMGTARRMIELIVSNANRTQSGWSVGVVEETETKLVDFSGYNCLAALTRISDEFGIEFWIDADKTIHLTERKPSSGYTFAYGKGKGLKSISRTPYTEASLITRLYAKGSEQNIPKGYRNGQKALRMDVPYLEMNTDKYGIVEHTQTFEDIYPKRVGTVTAVNEQNYLQFSDSTLDFDLNAYNEYGTTVLIAGTSAKVIFITGDLAGYTFEIKEYGFNSATKTFTLLRNKDEKSFDIPSENFRPKVGDQYILVDIMMPQSYVTAAESELKAKALDYLEKNSKQRFIYTMEPDPIYFKNLNVNLKLGQTVRFQDADFNLDDDIRVISLTKDLQNPYKVSFEIAEQATITQIVRNYIENEKKETAIKKGQEINAEMARRSYLFAEELKGNVFDNEGYFDTDKIKPLSIETQHISVGSRMQQLTLPNVILTLSEDNLRLKNTAGELVHLTINPLTPRVWNIAQNETPNFSTNFNYIYLKADKVGSNAVFVVSEQKIMLDNDPIFYYFLVGSVSSVIDGVRRIKTNYGFTQISPNEITTGRLSSANGQNWIDLLQDKIEINASVRFAPNSPALTQVDNAIQIKMNGLGSLAWKNAVEKAQLGETIIQGGYIKTELLNASAIVSNGGGVTNIALQNAINGLAIGGRNLFLSPKILSGYAVEANTSIPLVEGEEYVVSFDIKGQNNGRLFLNNAIIFSDIPINPNPNEWFRISKVFTFRKNDYFGKEIFPHIYGATDVRNAKLEKGNKPTDWTPAPEDLEAQFQALQSGINGVQNNVNTLQNGISNIQASLGDIKTKTDNFTSIQGGLVSSNIISVGSTQVNQNAFISGVTDAGGLSVRFGAGANYTNKNNAPFRVLDNGKMIAENAEINGKINAHSGKIGGFEINQGFTAYSYSSDSWANGNEYVSITPTSFLMRKNGHQRGEHQREVRMGITTSAASGWDGAVAMIENTLPPEFGFGMGDNVALMLKAKNSNGKNIALDIPEGDIRVKGNLGATTGEILVSKREMGNQFIYTYMSFTNGILTGLKTETRYF